MLPQTFLEPHDDPAFLRVVDRAIAGVVTRDAPEAVYLVHIDNWFDHKWLRYSGKRRFGFFGGGTHYRDTALDVFRQDRLTFPPFAPGRVVAQYYFCRTTRGDYEEQAPARLVHRRRRGDSARNLYRRVADTARSAAYFWYSSRGVRTGRGSLMTYNIDDGAVRSWYASWRRDGDGGWRLGLVKGVSRGAVEALFGTDPLRPGGR